MTKGVITGPSTRPAEYNVKLEFDLSQAEQISDRLRQKLIDLVQPILDAEVELIELNNQLNTKANQVNAEIEFTKSLETEETGPLPPETETVTRLLKELARLNAQVVTKKANLARAKLERAITARAKTTIDNAMAADSFNATPMFCADYTTDLQTGAEVGVVLVPGENTGATLTIYPAYQGGDDGSEPAKAAKWTAEKFGQLVPPYSMTPEATFYNWAMLAGWQRWMPTYRHAIITAIDESTCTADVEVDEARSSVTTFVSGIGSRGLQVNETHVVPYRMENVAIEYMDCDCDAFQVGDHVIIEFTNRIVRETRIFETADGRVIPSELIETPAWQEGNSRIIGFVDGPRPCPVIVEHGLISLDALTDEEPAAVYPTEDVLGANGDFPAFLDGEIFENSIPARTYAAGMNSISFPVGGDGDAKKQLWLDGMRPGNVSGLLRLAIQAQYGHKSGNLSLVSYATTDQSATKSYGIHVDGANRFYLISISGVTVTAQKLQVAPAVEALADGKDGEEQVRAWAYMLASARIGGLSASTEIDAVIGTTYAYGWKFNRDGTEASIVTTQAVLDDFNNIQYHTGRLYSMSIDVDESTEQRFNNTGGTYDVPVLSINADLDEEESANYTPRNNKSLLLFPNYQEFKQEHVIWHGLPAYEIVDHAAPIYCFYDADGARVVIRHKLETAEQACTLAAFNEWAETVKSCNLELATDTYECLDDPIAQGFFSDEIDTSGEEGSSGYYGDLSVSGELNGSTNTQLLFESQCGFPESKLCGARHGWDGEPERFGRHDCTWYGGDRVTYFKRVTSNYSKETESCGIIPFYDCESFYLGSFLKSNRVGDIVDVRKNVTLRGLGESGGGDTAFLTWTAFGSSGNGVSDASETTGPDHGPYSEYEREIKLHLHWRGGLAEDVATLAYSTDSDAKALIMLGPWAAIFDPELFVYRFFDKPVFVRQSYGGEMIYTTDPTGETPQERTGKTNETSPIEIDITSSFLYAGWA